MIRLTQLTLRRGSRVLIRDAKLAIHAGQKLGLVGKNGTGKSSLFALIRGELSADRGDCTRPRHWVIASVAQETPAVAQAAVEYVLDGDAELRSLESRLQQAEAREDADQIASLHERLFQIDGYSARARAASLLSGLGFADEVQGRPVSEFSGGWRMRLNLARALMCRSDLLLLDEPTNHLDFDAVVWLQTWLSGYSGTLLLISHDREFLDAVCTHTLHLAAETLSLYPGNYSAFERIRAERLMQQASLHAAQQREIAHLQKFVDRFRAKATKARQAQSRLKMIERMERIAPVIAENEFRFSFRAPDKLPSPLVRLNKVAVGYPDRTILRGLGLGIEPGERIALMGPNGAGKSTLVRLLAGELQPSAGEAVMHEDLQVGYFAQHQLEQLDPQASPILHFKRLDPQASEQDLRDYLGAFNFRGDRAFEAIAPFSGGEKARLALALVVYPRPNLLLLDEPTNHLDLDMRQALEMALNEYEGAVILVSHDRHLVASVCETLWRVAEGTVEVFDGDLDDYARWLGERGRQTSAKVQSVASTTTRPAARAAPELLSHEEIKALRAQVRQSESRQARLRDLLQRLETRLADPELYTAEDSAEVARLMKEQSELRTELEAAEEAWLEASEQLESRGRPS